MSDGYDIKTYAVNTATRPSKAQLAFRYETIIFCPLRKTIVQNLGEKIRARIYYSYVVRVVLIGTFIM